MTIYADVVFLINFIMDSFILWIVSKTGPKKVRAWRLLTGGLIMSVLYCLLIFTAAFRYMNLYAASVLILSLGVAVALRPTGVKMFAKLLLTAYALSFTVGGLGMVLFYLTDLPYAAYYLVANPETLTDGLSWKLPLICIMVSYLLIKLVLHAAERLTVKRQTLCPVKVYLGTEGVVFDALMDTGHSLREPISQMPVIIAEFESVKPFLPDALKILFYEKREDNLPAFIHTQDENNPFYHRLRVIPFTSLGQMNGLLIGFKPDRVEVNVSQQETSRTDVVIGIYNCSLTRDGRYHGLLSPEVVAVR